MHLENVERMGHSFGIEARTGPNVKTSERHL